MTRLLCIKSGHFCGAVKGQIYTAVGEYNCPCKKNIPVWIIPGLRSELDHCTDCGGHVPGEYKGLGYGPKHWFIPLGGDDTGVTEDEANKLYSLEKEKERA